MNVGEIQGRVKRQFGDEAGVQITDADIINWINDAQRDISSINNLLETSATASPVAGQQEYSLPADVQNLFSVWFNGERLEPRSMREAEETILKVGDPSSQPTGSPVLFWLFANKMYLWPVPSENSTDTLKLFYNRMPVAVAGSMDIPELNVKYHKSIVDYCLQQAYELDEDWAASTAKAGQVQSGVSSLMDSEKWVGQNTYPTITTLAEDM